MNSSNATVGPSTLMTYYQYIVIGTGAVLLNSFLLFVCLRRMHYLKKSAFIFGLAIGDLLDCIALLGNGWVRLYRFYNDLPDVKVHPSYCLQIYGFSAVFLMGNQIPGVMLFLIGVERLLAVQYFNWYFVKWNNKMAWKFTGAAYIFCALSLGAAYVSVNLQPPEARVSIMCITPTVMGKNYITYNYIVSVIGGVLATVTTIVAMISFTVRRRKLNSVSSSVRSHVKKQWSSSQMMLIVALLDFLLVVVPNVLLILSNSYGLLSIANIASYSLQIGCARSFINVLFYLINREFRTNVIYTVRFWKSSPHLIAPVFSVTYQPKQEPQRLK